MRFVLSVLLLSVCFTPAYAGSLQDYKKQKHEDRKRVDSDSCPAEYTKECQAACTDDGCRNACVANAPKFCEERSKRKFWKTAEVVGKGLSVGAGALGVILDKDMPEVGPDGTQQIGPYSIIWNAASSELNLGLGLIEAGGKAATTNFKFRHTRWGVATNVAYLWDKREHLMEADAGPTWSMASASFMFTLQPSVLASCGNGVVTKYGAGLRSYTQFLLGEIILFGDPMLGYINKNWQYHLRLGGTYRFTPNMGLSLAYEYRDLVDLGDLHISSASLQGASVYLNFRWN